MPYLFSASSLRRNVEIPEVDVEACGGTHLNSTGEAGEIKILKSAKIQDGIVRITFTAGKAAKKEEKEEENILEEAAKLLKCDMSQVPGRVEELFKKWKDAVKKGKKIDSKELSSTAKFDGDVLAKVSEILRTPPEHVVSTIKRFLKELDEA